MQNILPEKPFDLVVIDLFGEFPRGKGGVKYVFLMLVFPPNSLNYTVLRK